MASITKRAGKWTVTARLPDTFKGPCKSRSISNTFKSKRDAQVWIDATESAMRLGIWKDPRLDPKPGTLRGYLDRPFKDASMITVIRSLPRKREPIKRWRC